MENDSHINFLRIILYNCGKTLKEDEYLDIGEGSEDILNDYLSIIDPQYTHEEIVEAGRSLADRGFGVAVVDIPNATDPNECPLSMEVFYRLEDYANHEDITGRQALSFTEVLYRVSKRRYRQW